MTRFHKIQIISSIIPGVSTVFVALVTMFSLKKNNASKKIWTIFFLAFFLIGMIASAVINIFLKEQEALLQNIVTGLILMVLNVILVGIQVAVEAQPDKGHKTRTALSIYFWIIIIVVALVAVLVLVFGDGFDESIADINGDENSQLAVISDDMLMNEKDQYHVLFYAHSKTGEQTNVQGHLKEYDYAEISRSFGKLSGVMTIQATTTDSKQITLDLSSEIESGNLEFIIIVDGCIYERVSANADEMITVENANEKSVIVKLAAESAKGKILVKRTLGARS